MLVEAFALVRRGGSGEAGAVALGLRRQRELADDQRRAAGVEQRAVHAAGLVPKNAQIDDFARQPFGFFFPIALHGADQHEKAGPDLAGGPAIDGDGSGGDTLDEGSHLRRNKRSAGRGEAPSLLPLWEKGRLVRQRFVDFAPALGTLGVQHAEADYAAGYFGEARNSSGESTTATTRPLRCTRTGSDCVILINSPKRARAAEAVRIFMGN
jgi:hypothetical protein